MWLVNRRNSLENFIPLTMPNFSVKHAWMHFPPRALGDLWESSSSTSASVAPSLFAQSFTIFANAATLSSFVMHYIDEIMDSYMNMIEWKKFHSIKNTIFYLRKYNCTRYYQKHYKNFHIDFCVDILLKGSKTNRAANNSNSNKESLPIFIWNFHWLRLRKWSNQI